MELPKRKPMRLKKYDYGTPGAYFVTICTQNRRNLFWDAVIGWMKYQTTKKINGISGNIGEKIFQRSFHDHIIRGEKDYKEIWEYIDTNPAKWQEDCFYTA